MKILFLCGCIEPGLDGVGDYTRLLSTELIRHGHQIHIVALNDSFISHTTSAIQHLQGIEVEVLRIPSVYTIKRRSEIVENCVNEFNPDWISLQYVPYSFHPKGLPFGLAKSLLKMGEGKNWHIMFHETWVGISKISPLKHKITGVFQRRIAKSIYTVLQPKVVTTSNRLYQLLLQNNQIPTSILTLFSNIPISEPNHIYISEVFSMLGLKPADKDKLLIVGIFGSLYPDANLEEAISEQFTISEKDGKELVVLGFGRINEDGVKEFERLSLSLSSKARFMHLREQSMENVSTLFSIIDIALSCTPEQHLAKSGVFAAMKLHGLNVITSASEELPEYQHEITSSNRKLIDQPASHWGVDYIAQKFITLLKN